MDSHIHNGIDNKRINPVHLLGFPIFNQVPTHKAEEGTWIFVRLGGSYYIYAMIDRVWQGTLFTLGGGSAALTSTHIGFGSGANLMTSSSDLTWNNTTKVLTVNGKLTVTGAIDPTMLFLDEQGSDPTAVLNKGVIYTKDVAGVSQLYYRASDGTVSQITPPSGGGVTSVSGTANRITSTGGATPVIDIAGTYVGQSSITTLGTVTVGTLSTGAVIGGVTMTLGSDAQGDMYYRDSSGVLARMAIGADISYSIRNSGGNPVAVRRPLTMGLSSISGQSIAAGATSFMSIGGFNAVNATESNRATVVGLDAISGRMVVTTVSAQPATGSLVLTLRRGTGGGAFADTTQVVTIAAGSAAGVYKDTTNTTTWLEGDLASIRIVNNAATGSANIVGATLFFY